MSSDRIQSLIERSARADERAFAELYDETSAYVFGILRKMLGSDDRAEDVAQEVYVQIWRSAGTYDPERSSPWTWIALLTRSRAVDRLRSDRSRDDASDDLERQPATAPLGNPGPGPAGSVEIAERSEAVRSSVASLPDEQAAALRMAFFGGLTHREIAETTSTPLGTIKSRIRTGLQKIRESLGGDPRGGSTEERR